MKSSKFFSLQQVYIVIFIFAQEIQIVQIILSSIETK